jgi:hypothetical protein
LERGRNPRSNIRRSLTKDAQDDQNTVGWEGSLLPLSIEEEMSHFVRHDNNDVILRSDSDERSPPFSLSPRADFARGLLLESRRQTLLETPPLNDFMPLGKSWKGGVALVPIMQIPHFVRNDTKKKFRLPE